MAATLTLPPTPLQPGDRVAIALSGGADSTALLLLTHAANTLPRNALGIGLSAIHIHHGLRGEEADADQAFAAGLCARLEIPLLTRKVDTRAHARQHGETLEEAARTLRYAVFRELITSGQASAVLTAHTLDDQAETVLMKLLRGAWLEGLSGISPAVEVPVPGGPAGRILRPLLATRRTDLRIFLEVRNQPWREDSSNADESFTRNRLRHSVLPVLRQENPSIDQTLAHLAELARDEEAHWQPELKRLIPQLVLPGKPVRGGGRSNSTAPGDAAVAIELDRLRALDSATRRRIVRAAARQLGTRLSFDETARLLTFAGLPSDGVHDPAVPSRPGGKFELSQELTAERSARELRLSIRPKRNAPQHPEPPPAAHYPTKVPE